MSSKPNGRPKGQVRQALLAAAKSFQADGLHPTWRDLAARAQVGTRVARFTCWNMVEAGELQIVGHAVMPRSKKPMALFEPAEPCIDHVSGSMPAIGNALAAWFEG